MAAVTELTPVTGSSNIKAAGYDEESKTMVVEFNSGTYEYSDVTPYEYDAFAATFDSDASTGRHFNATFRGKHACRKISS